MQPQATYEKEDAENIIRDYLNGWVEWRNNGLFIQQGMVENDPTGSVFHWTPAYNMEWDGAPDPMTAPSLPFPFTANQLAAFMVNGIGTGVAAAYGTWEHGPDEAAMDEAMGIRARRAREALRKAFFLYREAEKIVGELAPEVWSECLPIHPSILRAQGKKLALQATLKHLSWCRAMTRQLLQPQATTPSRAAEPQATPVVTVGASDGVVTDKAGPLPLTTNDIANCFSGFREWDVRRWKAELGSPDKWLQACQHRKGIRGKGGYESTWWPVQIAVALANKDQKSARHLRARFKRFEQLSPWLDELEINIPDNSDSQ